MPQQEKPNLWHRDSSLVEECNSGWSRRMQFMAGREGGFLTFTKQLILCSNVLEIATAIAGMCQGRMRSLWDGEIWVEGSLDGSDLLIEVEADRRGSHAWDGEEAIGMVIDNESALLPLAMNCFNVTVTAPKKAIEHLFGWLDGLYSQQQAASLCWWYDGGARGAAYRKIYLPPVRTSLHREYYPGLEVPPQTFIQDYLRAPESVLLMCGPPGTGKTTLLRHMIVEHHLTAHVCYDERLMQSDQLFQSFLTDKTADILIIEDADVVLSSRERDDNHLMSRFLNISDGLIKLPNKKLVFTTNLTDFHRIDSAMLRPGRCFALVHTRPLSLVEAQAASKVGGFPTPTERKEYTLAELFNQGKSTANVRRFGFRG